MLTLLLIAVTLALIYFLVQWQFNHWKRRGIPYETPVFPYGTFRFNHPDLHFAEQAGLSYEKFKGKTPVFGGFRTLEPVLFVADTTLAKQLLIKEFHIFHDRGLYHNPRDDPILNHLFVMEGQKWKKLREKLTPVFTTGKMKLMFAIVANVATALVETLRNETKITNPIELKDVIARFTTDVIGHCAFGLDTNSLQNSKSEFRKHGKMFFESINPAKIFVASAFPKLARFFHMRVSNVTAGDFMTKVVEDTIAYREKNQVERGDFMDLMIKLRNKDKPNDHQMADMDGLSVHEIVANCVLFFVAGFDTSSSTAAFAIHELSKNPELQTRTRRHINDVLKKYNGEFTYEALQEMTFLEQILNETLRIYPVAPFLIRVANQNYKVPDSNIVIEKGRTVFIPTYGFQHDPDIFEDPYKFDPDRLGPGKKFNKDAMLFFGDGPRACIGERFGRLQAKVALVLLLKNFEFSLKPEDRDKKVRFNTKTILLTCRDGLKIEVTPIEQSHL